MIMRELVNRAIVELCGDVDVALSFSGGTDSTCLLFSLVQLGYSPTLYTYHVDGVVTADLERARIASKVFGLPLVECPIPANIPSIAQSVKKMIEDGIEGKVSIQCMHGHYMVAPKVKQGVIVNGSGIDALYGVYKTFAFDGSKIDKAKFDYARNKHLANPNDDAMVYQSELYARFGVHVVYPFRTTPIIQFLMQRTWAEINKPSLKAIITNCYPEFSKMPKGYFRPRGSQQIVAGTRELHNLLLKSHLNK